CAPAGEYHLAGPGIEQLGNRLASLLDRVPCPLAVPMDGRGVAEVLEQVRLHRLKHFRRQRRGRVVVQINSSHNGYFPWKRLSFRALRCHSDPAVAGEESPHFAQGKLREESRSEYFQDNARFLVVRQ